MAYFCCNQFSKKKSRVLGYIRNIVMINSFFRSITLKDVLYIKTNKTYCFNFRLWVAQAFFSVFIHQNHMKLHFN